jgi:uncharacterized membrane protein YfcA
VWPDYVNGTFELCGGVFIALSVRQLLKDKMVRGVSWLAILFFTAWGYWNLFFYPHLDQWLSFAGGVGLALANTVYLALLVHYWRARG